MDMATIAAMEIAMVFGFEFMILAGLSTYFYVATYFLREKFFDAGAPS
jgi:hypothetical protein